MEVTHTSIPDVLLLKPKVFADDRGYFLESFNSHVFAEKVNATKFVQDNESQSSRGVLRGLHYQLSPMAQTKLVRVVRGKIWDVAVDIRKSSPTFGKWTANELSEENKCQMLIPAGFAHGFVVLSDQTIVQYKVDNFYSKEHDRGIRFDDPALGIKWPVIQGLILSEKDKALPTLAMAEVFA
ncbi:MAG: dTDP-4-dehydrorhamnose 3,5-epimerase [Proteobacteria bacterium]|nr:MAG: dTDP-4-dehydrorhamnose 3,5-epimerase [Pseudomonadota bacterium]